MPASQPRERSRRLRALRAGPSAILALAILACAAPSASAMVVPAEAAVGLQPRSTSLYEATGSTGFTNTAGNPIVSSSSVVAIYWDPDDLYHGDWQHLIDGFMANMGADSGALSSVFAVDSQYTDLEGKHAAYSTTFKGSYTDTDPYPVPTCKDPAPLLDKEGVTCLTNQQIEAELTTFIKDHSLPTGMGTIYYLLTPPGVTACLGAGAVDCSDFSGEAEAGNPSYDDSFCSYHSAIEPGGGLGNANTVLYAVVPWTAGGLGDYHLAEENRTAAYECQAGGWKPGTAEEEVEAQETSPVQQEPNQTGRGPDGSFDTGLADLIVNQIAVEQQDIVTDPLLNAWQGAGGDEVTDECRDFFAPALGGSNAAEIHTGAGNIYNQSLAEGRYFLNDSYNLAGSEMPYPGIPCLNKVALEPSFTAPNTVNTGELVGFNGMESDVSLDWGTAYESGAPTPTYATYEWNFGDGTTETGSAPGAPSTNSPSTSPCEGWPAPCAASAFHSYVYGGTYEVTLKVTDTGGDSASFTAPITVDGPPAPTPPSSSLGSTPSGGTGEGKSGGPGATGFAKSSNGSKSSQGTPVTGKSKGSKAPLSRPVATAIVTTTSLNKAVEAGLGVRYSVNQQVAGHFEVLLPTRLAKRLKIKGAKAKGLPAGMARETVIAYALLETTRSAHGTISIAIPGSTGRQLDRLRHVKLTLRLVVRNASRTEPKTTLLMTAVKLRR